MLFSGDGDFRSLVEALQRTRRTVTVVSTLSTQPPMIADELRRQADHSSISPTLHDKIGRDPAERAAREAAREPQRAVATARTVRRRDSRTTSAASRPSAASTGSREA